MSLLGSVFERKEACIVNQKVDLHFAHFSCLGMNLSAVPKKKRRADPSQLKAKEERRRKKIAKALR
jgi:hypothetical protein